MLLAASNFAIAADPVAIFHVLATASPTKPMECTTSPKARKHYSMQFGRQHHLRCAAGLALEPPERGLPQLVERRPTRFSAEGKWDVLILQPFNHAPEAEAEGRVPSTLPRRIRGLTTVRRYAFANYPEIGKDREKANEWEARWLSQTEPRGRAKIQKVAKAISAKFPDKKPVRIIPVGEVMYRMHQRMKDGKVPGFKHIADLYEDGTIWNCRGVPGRL